MRMVCHGQGQPLARVYMLLPLLQYLPDSHTISALHHLLGLLWVVSLFGEVQWLWRLGASCLSDVFPQLSVSTC